MKKEIKIKGKRADKLFVFDLDETLVMSNANILVIDKKTKEIVKRLSSKQFNSYIKKSNEILSFSEFNDYQILLNSTFTKYMKKIKSYYKKGYHISVITARSDEKMVDMFLTKQGIKIHPNLLFAINDLKYHWASKNIEDKKAEAIKNLITVFGYTNFVIIDDNELVLDKIQDLEEKYDINVETIKA